MPRSSSQPITGRLCQTLIRALQDGQVDGGEDAGGLQDHAGHEEGQGAGAGRLGGDAVELSAHRGGAPRLVVLMHLSQENNTEELALSV